MKPKKCISCNEPLKGKFCHNCGEKVVEKNDFSLQTIFKQFIDGFTNFDSKFIKSFYYLLLKPGKLTENYVAGLRNPFMKPFQLFIVVNVLFFLFLPNADIFKIPSDYYFSLPKNNEQLQYIITTKNTSKVLVLQQFDSEALTNSKLYIFALLPFFSFVFWLLNYKNKQPFGIHFIFAIHFLSFFMLFCLSFLLFPKSITNAVFTKLYISIIPLLYLFFAIKKFYKKSILITALQTIISGIVIFYSIIGYRELISQFTLYSIMS
ncbi:DUF3667 domain-containing protein [Flavobacterium sp.]|uniref:DUF3667 domain-containing protein n=1 Tax=Flavobacterium sp. TaxID=239 RepID=UPI00352720E3